jgi:hypothetical protein
MGWVENPQWATDQSQLETMIRLKVFAFGGPSISAIEDRALFESAVEVCQPDPAQ